MKFKWKQISEIVEGYSNWILETEEIKKVSEERLNICLVCSFRNDYEESKDKINLTSYCTVCGCELKAKTKCLSCKCPEPYNKWEAYESGTKSINRSDK